VVRAVLDVRVVAAGLLAPSGPCADVLRAWLAGSFDLWSSPAHQHELERVLRHPTMAGRVAAGEAAAVVELIRSNGLVVDDEFTKSRPAADAGLGSPVLSLARSVKAVVVTSDDDLLALAGEAPVLSPAQFLEVLEEPDPSADGFVLKPNRYACIGVGRDEGGMQ